MSERWRISGKKVELPLSGVQGWKWTVRPGGWILGEGPDGTRKRLAVVEFRTGLGANLSGVLYQGEVQKPTRSAGGAAGAGDGDLTAQFPGKVRKVLVSAGAKVAEGESLILVEAMKMEFAVKAPSHGIVKAVLVKEGQQLSPGDRFFEFEASEAKRAE